MDDRAQLDSCSDKSTPSCGSEICFDSAPQTSTPAPMTTTTATTVSKISDDQIKALDKVFRNRSSEVYKSVECKEMMDVLRLFSSELVHTEQTVDIRCIVDNDTCVFFYRKYVLYASDNSAKLLGSIGQRQFVNFIKLNMALWNFTDKYDNLCVRMVKHEVHLQLIRLLLKIPCSEQDLLQKSHLLMLVMSIVGILHNINRKLQYTRGQFREEKLVEYLMPLALMSNQQSLLNIKTAALLLLAFLVNENENSVLNATDEHMVYFINILRDALDSPKFYSTYYGYHCLEILHGLRHIAAPDANKRSLVRNGLLSHIGALLSGTSAGSIQCEDGYTPEVSAALELLWSLSFSRDCLLAMDAKGCYLRARVEELAQGQHVQQGQSGIVLAARGVLWNLKNSLSTSSGFSSDQDGGEEHGSGSCNGAGTLRDSSDTEASSSFNSLIRKDSSTNPNSKGHIMISYQHSMQVVMCRIRDSLVANGYRVWMDVDHMTGSFVDAMAEGIQHASLLLLGMCQAFKNSPHCRQEVKYAYLLGIPLVPIMLEPGYVPDGWLGLMCATLIYTDFFVPPDYEHNMRQLVRQLGTRGRAVLNQQQSPSVTDSLDGGTATPGLQTQFGPVSCDLMCCSTDDTSPLPNGTSHHGDAPDFLQTSFRSDHSSAMARSITSASRQAQFPLLCQPPSMTPPQTSRIDCPVCSTETASASPGKLIVMSWDPDQCRLWLSQQLCDILDDQSSPLAALTGPLLLEWAEMRRAAPDCFFSVLRTELGLSLLDQLRLSRALRLLDEMPL